MSRTFNLLVINWLDGIKNKRAGMLKRYLIPTLLVIALTGCDQKIPEEVRVCGAGLGQLFISSGVAIRAIDVASVPAAPASNTDPAHTLVRLTYSVSPERSNRPNNRQAECKIYMIQGSGGQPMPTFLSMQPDTSEPLIGNNFSGPLGVEMQLAQTVKISPNVWWMAPGYQKIAAITPNHAPPMGW